MKVYKEFYDSDMYDLLSRASDNGHLQANLIGYDLSRLLYQFIEDTFGDDISEDELYDYIRFDMEIQTEEEIKDNYEEAKESEDMEDFLSYHTAYIGNYEENGKTYYVFTSF